MTVFKELLHKCHIPLYHMMSASHDAEKSKNKNYLLIIPHLEKNHYSHGGAVSPQIFFPRTRAHTHARAHTCAFLFIALGYTKQTLGKPPFSLQLYRESICLSLSTAFLLLNSYWSATIVIGHDIQLLQLGSLGGFQFFPSSKVLQRPVLSI